MPSCTNGTLFVELIVRVRSPFVTSPVTCCTTVVEVLMKLVHNSVQTLFVSESLYTSGQTTHQTWTQYVVQSPSPLNNTCTKLRPLRSPRSVTDVLFMYLFCVCVCSIEWLMYRRTTLCLHRTIEDAAAGETRAKNYV